MLIKCDRLACPGGELLEGPLWVRVEGETVKGVERDLAPASVEESCLHTHLLTPGFIDLHTHGVGKSDT